MANKDGAFGLRPVRYLNGAPWNGQTNMYLIPSTNGTATFVGDAVTLGGTAGAAGTVVNGIDVEGMPTILQAAAGSTPVGVVVGFLPDLNDQSYVYRKSSTNKIALVVDDPWVIFEVQEDSDTSTSTITEIGENADLIVGSGSTTTGQSGMELDSTSHATSTATLRILRLVPRPDNSISDTTDPATAANVNARFEVLFNEHLYKGTTGV